MNNQLTELLIKAIRANYHSVRQAATLIGINQSLLNRIVTGSYNISASNAIKIAQYLNISNAEALQLAGHADIVPLLNDIAPKSKLELKEIKASYITANEQEDQLKEMTRLFSQLPLRDKHIWLEQLRTYVKSTTEIKI